MPADWLLCQREIHFAIHRRNGAWRQPGLVIELIIAHIDTNKLLKCDRLTYNYSVTFQMLKFCWNLQIIVKEKGIFTNVASPSAKAKLRLLFEVAPLGFLIEKAGGYSSDGTKSVLDRVITNLDDRTQVAYGSKNEIIRFEEMLYGSSRLKAPEPVGAAAWPNTEYDGAFSFF